MFASSAHPGAFAPRLLDRSDDEEGYRSHGIDSFPESGQLWYTDGGLLQSQPIGRVLAAAQRPEREGEDARHLKILIDPRSEAPSASAHWSDPELEPTWQAGLARALAILPAQVLYEDLRRIEKDNYRLAWAEQLIEELAPHLGDDAREALSKVVDRIDQDREGLRSDEPGRDTSRSDDGADAKDLLRRAAGEIGGLLGKRHVEVDVISPLVLADESGDVAGLLAGELIGDFGGFLSRELRASDFGLGYESALAWARDGLAGLRAGGRRRRASRRGRGGRSALPLRGREAWRGRPRRPLARRSPAAGSPRRFGPRACSRPARWTFARACRTRWGVCWTGCARVIPTRR